MGPRAPGAVGAPPVLARSDGPCSSLRALYDLGDPAQSRFIHSSGQSGLPWSKWYRDFMPLWVGVDYVPVFTREAAVATLQLQPGR